MDHGRFPKHRSRTKYNEVRVVSAAEIINELPKLTETERRAVREKLSELAAQNEDIQACHQAALEGALILDRMENEDARKQR